MYKYMYIYMYICIYICACACRFGCGSRQVRSWMVAPIVARSALLWSKEPRGEGGTYPKPEPRAHNLASGS